MKSSLPRKVQCVETGEIFNSIHEAARKFQCNPANISRIVNDNLDWVCAGVHWKALEPNKEVRYTALPNKGIGESFNTKRELAEFLGVSIDVVKYHLQSHTPIRGYTIDSNYITA